MFHTTIYTGLCTKHIYDTTQQMYTEVINLWFKGTGGGSGATTMFEGWSDEKLKNFDIDIDIRSH